MLDFYGESPDDPFAVAAREYSLAKLAILDGDLAAAERHYRAATEGFAPHRPPGHELSMCLGMVADFDERAGDYAAAIRRWRPPSRPTTSRARGLHRLAATLASDGRCSTTASVARAEAIYQRALDAARRVRTHAR